MSPISVVNARCAREEYMVSLKGQGYAIGAALAAAAVVVLMLWSESISTRIAPNAQTGAARCHAQYGCGTRYVDPPSWEARHWHHVD